MRKNHCIFTVDYETWQPVPAGCKIDWKRDLIQNADRLMEVFEKNGARLTFMVEMCEYFWLRENEPDTAEAVERQIQDMAFRGHDVQLHLHPNWMPECGVYTDGEKWEWRWDQASAETYPFDFSRLVQKCRERLEEIVQKVRPGYRVRAYRAGAYRVQPFDKTYQALEENGILIDTSVYKGGVSGDRGYDFRKCRSANRPYYADSADPQLAKQNGGGIIELPITTWKDNARLFLDNDEAQVFAKRFLGLSKEYFKYDDNFFVFIGHSKGDHDYKALDEQLQILSNYPGIVFTTLSECGALIKNSIGGGYCQPGY